MYAHHLANLPEDSLGHFFYAQLVKNNSLPGLVREVENHVLKMGIRNLAGMTKWTWKRLVKLYIFEKNKNEITEMTKKYKKICYNEIASDSFERKPFMINLNLEDARMIFRVKSKLVPTICKNFFPSIG